MKIDRRTFGVWCAAGLLKASGANVAQASSLQFQSQAGSLRYFQMTVPESATGNSLVRHRFLALDAWGGRLHHVDQFDPAKNWVMTVGGLTRDMQLIGGGRLLVPSGQGFRVWDLERKTMVEEIRRPELEGSQSALRLADGTTLLGANQKDGLAILVLDPAHRLARKIRFPQLKYLRLIRGTPQDTLLLSEYDGCSEVTIAPDVPDSGRVLRRFALPRPRNAFMALRRPNGNTLVSGGYAAGLFEYGPDGKLVREFAAKQPAGMGNWFYAGFQVLSNGHIVQANWNGHNQKDFHAGWQLIEFDEKGEVAWFWHEPPEKVGAINNVIVLDGDPK